MVRQCCSELPEEPVVCEGHDVDHEPEETAVLSVVEVVGGDVLDAALLASALQEAFHVLVEPGLVPAAKVVQLVWRKIGGKLHIKVSENSSLQKKIAS